MTTRQVELTEKKKFAIAALDVRYKIFRVHVIVLNIDSVNKIYPLKKAQIPHLKANEAPTKVPSKYGDFADIFLVKLAIELPKHMETNNHAIKLVNNCQFLYGLIYNLALVK